MANGYECYCNGAWMSVAPLPRCPIHYSPSATWRLPPRPRFRDAVAPLCNGRHCAHDSYCRGGVSFNG